MFNKAFIQLHNMDKYFFIVFWWGEGILRVWLLNSATVLRSSYIRLMVCSNTKKVYPA